jgi:hypothetical protein
MLTFLEPPAVLAPASHSLREYEPSPQEVGLRRRLVKTAALNHSATLPGTLKQAGF